MDTRDFKEWLELNSNYTKRVISNTVSRINRADRILDVYGEEVYLFELEHQEEFKNLSVAVKSQIRKAVKLYFEYLQSRKN